MSKPDEIARALAMIAAGMTWKDASEKCNIAQSTILRAIAREKLPKCPCCGKML